VLCEIIVYLTKNDPFTAASVDGLYLKNVFNLLRQRVTRYRSVDVIL
jgi:hypothetical protein